MTKSECLKLLISRLDQTDADWDDIEDLLPQFPGWLSLVRALRYPVRPMDNRVHWGPVQSEYTQIPDKDRARLLEFFLPFSILLDDALTPAGRVEALKIAGIDPSVFCKEHWHDAIPEICESAEAVLEVLAADRTLLRWHRKPQKPEQLLRQADEDRNEALLHPAAETAAVVPERTFWFKRSKK